MRLKTPVVKIGRIKIGFNNPILIQSMTNTQTSDIRSTVKQCIELFKAGTELVRLTVNDEAAAKAIPIIRKTLDQKGFKNFPLIGDFHFNGAKLLKKYPDCAKSLDKYRINPGNEKDFKKFIKIAIKYDKPIRIGLNEGSFSKEKMVASVLKCAKLAEKFGLQQNKIVLSVKMTDVKETVEAYRLLAKKMKQTKHFYATHLGLTEAGSGRQGVVFSAVALGILLNEGIGDTIRVSVTPDQDNDRTQEVKICKDILQALNLRNFSPRIISCPGCGRTDNVYFQKLVAELNKIIEKIPNLKNKKIAIMGCVVNGPGEAKYADIAICLPGLLEKPVVNIYSKNKLIKTLSGKNVIPQIEKFLKNNLNKK